MNKCKFDPKTGAMIIFLIIFSLIVSLKMNNYTVLVVNMALINMITAYGLSIMLGMCGQLVFSGVAFMGIGAYITANLCSGRMNFILPGYAAIIVSVVLTALIA